MHRGWIEPAVREVTSMKIAVIGAGDVGLATAYLLASQGNEVVVLEAREAAGMGTSFGNGGQLSYSYVAPLAAPSVLNDIPKWILDPTSPLRFKPSFEIAQWKWITAFLRACTSKPPATGSRCPRRGGCRVGTVKQELKGQGRLHVPRRAFRDSRTDRSGIRLSRLHRCRVAKGE